MSSSGNLEVEELQNYPLVRMEDVQPSKKCEKYEEDEISVLSEVSQESQTSEEMIETCVVDGSEYHCLADDDDSDIGSMVSIKYRINKEDTEFIVPDIIENQKDNLTPKSESPPPITQLPTIQALKTTTSGSWPTLEILPGGVINLTERVKPLDEDGDAPKTESLFACAKCPEQFNYLFCLVKHVKVHEEEERRIKFKKLMLEEQAAKQNKNIKTQVDEKRSTQLKEKIVAVTRAKPQRGRKAKKPKVQVLQEGKQSYVYLDGRKLRLYDKPQLKVPKKKS